MRRRIPISEYCEALRNYPLGTQNTVIPTTRYSKIWSVFVVGVVAIGIYIKMKDKKIVMNVPDPEIPLPPSDSLLYSWKRAVVSSDGHPCSQIGRNILNRNGSAVDAAVAAMLCNGLVNCHSMGLGGGFFMVAYDKSRKESFTLDARETAPAATNAALYDGKPYASKKGPLAVGIPGELKGYWEAHKRFGRLPWTELVHPTIEICEKGYRISKHQVDSLKTDEDNIKRDSILRDIFIDPGTGSFWREGSLIHFERICKTLRIIEEKGGDELYNGKLAEELVKDVQDMGGIITLQDLSNYRVRWGEAVKITLQKNLLLHTTPLPSSGPLLAFILSVIDMFGPLNITNDSSTITTYHRITEVFKYAFALRGKLGDPQFADVNEVIKNLTSRDFAKSIRRKIQDSSTSNDAAHYQKGFSISPDNDGTAHVSVIAPNGDAVSITSSINLYFGAGFASKSTGIILNSCIDDFSIPGSENYFGIPLSEANQIFANKRALSSMSPAIITNRNGNVKMVIGGAGGTKIPTAISLVAWRYLWLNQSIKEAVDASRFHHQLFPMEISYEYGNLKQVLVGLKKLGHKVSRYRERGSIINAIVKQGKYLYANIDHRKGGQVLGLN